MWISGVCSRQENATRLQKWELNGDLLVAEYPHAHAHPLKPCDRHIESINTSQLHIFTECRPIKFDGLINLGIPKINTTTQENLFYI